ncbi:MAG: hypothetical protein ACOWWO_13185 [Peptococcaceae bacterium]
MAVILRKIFFTVLCMIFFLTMLPAAALADIGPKPSVVLDFAGLENERYYVTLLSEKASTGPYSAIDAYPDRQRVHPDTENYEIWEKFASYDDEDGYYFLQYFTDCSETSRFEWGYYPPARFKILMYFPDYDEFAAGEEIYERYAFDSYYFVDGQDLDFQKNTTARRIKAEKNYDYSWELISLAARIAATVTTEVFIACLFGFRLKKQLVIIAGVNIATQSILNILLNVINYHQGSMMFVLHYIWMEVLVVLLEAGAYAFLLPGYGRGKMDKKWFILLYALVANGVSFALGLYLAYRIPGIF